MNIEVLYFWNLMALYIWKFFPKKLIFYEENKRLLEVKYVDIYWLYL